MRRHKQLDTVPTPEQIAEAFVAEAGSHFQIANYCDPGGTYRLIVRKHCPSVTGLLKDRPLLIQAITDALAGKATADTDLKAAQRKEEQDGADRAKSGEWILAIPRGGSVFEAWDNDGWYSTRPEFVDGADREHVLWDGKRKRKVLAARITKEQAVEHLMERAYEDSTIPF